MPSPVSDLEAHYLSQIASAGPNGIGPGYLTPHRTKPRKAAALAALVAQGRITMGPQPSAGGRMSGVVCWLAVA